MFRSVSVDEIIEAILPDHPEWTREDLLEAIESLIRDGLVQRVPPPVKAEETERDGA